MEACRVFGSCLPVTEVKEVIRSSSQPKGKTLLDHELCWMNKIICLDYI